MDIIDTLMAERPRFHGEEAAGTASYSIGASMLQWLARNVPRGAKTLETGCGYSTIAFATRSGDHTVVSPFEGEHDLIRGWCTGHGFSLDHVTFVAEPSQRFLPVSAEKGFGVVLIDGDHAFPAPFLDWYYIAEKVIPSGAVIVDDTQLTTGRILREFLLGEAGRWGLEEDVGRAAVFRRISAEPVAEGVNWTDQPYVRDLSRMSPNLPQRAKRLVSSFLPEAVKDGLRKRLRGLLPSTPTAPEQGHGQGEREASQD